MPQMTSRTRGSRATALAFLTIGTACSPSIADPPAKAPPAVPEHALHLSPQTRHSALRIPDSIRVEHEQIHAALVKATNVPGAVGEAARELARVLHPHFVREEEIALPPLDMHSVLHMTDALRQELPQMLREHVEISAATRRLAQISAEAGDRETEELARELSSHARSEEEVFYPAAILVGEVVRARLHQQEHQPTSAR